MIKTFEQSLQYIFSHIPKTEMRKFPGEQGLARIKELLSSLGNPQDQYKVVHVAGTSGKGSTSTIISHGLVSQGFKVGLQMSPHLLDIRERIQINNSLISEEKFVTYLNEIIPAIEKISNGEHGQVTYFEILVTLAYYAFWKESVEYAVIETGMGGLYDGTNVVHREDKIAVITSIGFDHMSVLGNTLSEIAFQKAGIIHSNNTVITTQQEESAQAVISSQAEKMNAPLTVLQPSDIKLVEVSESGTWYVDTKRKIERHLSLIGKHQAENAQLAIEVVYQLAKRDAWKLDEQKLEQALDVVTLPGRMDFVTYNGKQLLVDGAHNTQKMDAFLSALSQIYPGKKHTFLVAFKHGKDISSMIESIEGLAKEIIVTDFWVDTQDMLNISEPIETVASYVKLVPVTAISGTRQALECALEKDDHVIVTGSLYFASEIYKLLP